MTSTAFADHGARSSVTIERYFPHPVEKVWAAVTEPEHLGQWFPSPVEVDLRPGGPMRFPAFPDGPAATGRVESVDVPRLLTFTWGADHFAFALESAEGGTVFRLIHTFDDRAGAASFATGWEICLAGLTAVLAGVPLPTPDAGYRRHEELVVEFGLDRPVTLETDHGWALRYERQLTCPAQVAWDAWFGTDQVTRQQRRAPAVGEPMTPGQAPEVLLGQVREVDEPRQLALDLAPGVPGDHLNLELGAGTGHGARVTLTVTGTRPDQRGPAEQEWGAGALRGLAAAGLAWAMSGRSI